MASLHEELRALDAKVDEAVTAAVDKVRAATQKVHDSLVADPGAGDGQAGGSADQVSSDVHAEVVQATEAAADPSTVEVPPGWPHNP